MFDVIIEMFSYQFLVRAIVGGLLVSLCAALLGVSLVLKRYSMIGDGLSHVGFGALAIATAANVAPLEFAIPIVVAAAFLLLRISENSKIKGDAAIALISTASLAIGIMAATMSTGLNTDINSYLFGSILSMSAEDVWLCIILSVIVLCLFVVFYNKIFAVTFDENFAKATGTKAGAYNMIIALLTALTIVVGMKMMGSLLISSLIIFPAITSMRVCKRFKTVMITSAIVSVVCFFIGIVISYMYSTPTGASIVIVNLGALILFSLAGFVIRQVGARRLET
ncbi:MAG: metal ABC transporter permease [Acutalibacteraceae bacterium]